MKYISFFALPFFVMSSFGMQLDDQIYPANAGANTQATQIPQSEDSSLDSSSDNIFLEYYAKQGSDFSASVFEMANEGLVKRDISYDSLKKAVVIFFGDWCPHCHKFLTEFAQYLSVLEANGIRVILLDVPSVDRLKNWQDPSVQDYYNALQRVQSYGISLSSNVELFLLGDRTTLARTGVSGLPVFIAIKDSKERFRGVGNSGVSKLQLSDPNVLSQFLGIWSESVSPADQAESTEVKKNSTKKSVKNIKKKNVKTSTSKKKKGSVKLSPSALAESRLATDMLNSCQWNKIDLNR